MSKTKEFFVEIPSASKEDIPRIMEELQDLLGADGHVELTVKDDASLPSRTGDPSSLIPLIGVTLTALQAGIAVASIFHKMSHSRIGLDLIVVSRTSKKQVHIRASDSLDEVRAKFHEAFGKSRLLNRLLRR